MESGIKEETNKDKVKTLLESGERISVKSVWRVIRTTETRHYVSQLKRDGLLILSEWVERNGYRFKEYWLAKKEVQNA